jgi:hypothetical protein
MPVSAGRGASGRREHAGGMADVQRDQNNVPLMNLPRERRRKRFLRNYVERYVYDAVGNI